MRRSTPPCSETVALFLGSSAEETNEALEDGDVQINNIVNSFRLTQTSFVKKSFMVYIKVRRRWHDGPYGILAHTLSRQQGYMKAIKAHLQETNPDRVSAFESGAQTWVKKVLGNFKDYEFYTVR